MRGGKRPGSGRPWGSRNKATEKQKAEIDKITASGGTPLDYLLSVMHNTAESVATRLEAAKAAAPYIHARLASIDNTHRGPDGGPVRSVYYISDKPMTEEEWERERCGKE